MIDDPSEPLSGILFVPVVAAIALAALAIVARELVSRFEESAAATLERIVTAVVVVGGAYTVVLLLVVVVSRFEEVFVAVRVMTILFVLALLPLAVLVGLHRLFTRGNHLDEGEPPGGSSA